MNWALKPDEIRNEIKLLAYIGRRISIAVMILFGSTFITYNLEAYAGDPIAGLAESTVQNKWYLIHKLTRELQLDVPPPARYFLWLKGVLAGLTGNLDLGLTRKSHSVAQEIAAAIPVTIRLLTTSTILAIVLGITIGVISAIRQYSRLDYSLTFVAFLMFSLPIFWVAVLLKQFMAIGFNNYLEKPNLDLLWVFLTAAAFAFVLTGFVSGTRKRVLITFGSSFVIFSSILFIINQTKWVLNPTLGVYVIGLLGVGIAFGMTYVFVGLQNRKALYAALTSVGVAVLMYFPFQTVVNQNANFGLLVVVALLMLSVSYFIGYFFTKIDKGPVIQASMLTAFLTSFLVVVDKILQSWKPYMNTPAVAGRPIQTLGPSNSLLVTSDFWMQNLDIITHIALPTMALTLIGFSGYVRYTRGSLLEVLNMDYIRTARAKGLGEREVILRHAFRNAMIPLTTLVAYDIAGILGGAIITESVFGWHGMGSLFNEAIQNQDLKLLMGTFAITAFLAVMATLAADLIYTALDPRIRIGKK
jgi:peptide/nickel transport system permease protein